MPYTATNWVNGSTPANATNMNHLETQYTEATSSFNQDEYTPYILSGLIASKDATTASKLNITSGVAYVLQGDNTTRRRAVASTSQTTSAISSTYYLYVQPDGSLYWSTTNTPAANSLAIAQVTTDSSGNISGVTDKRTLGVTVLNGKDANLGAYTVPAPLSLKLSQNGALAGALSGGYSLGNAGGIWGDFGTCAIFNGSSGEMTSPTTGLPTGNAAWSLECWANSAGNSALGILMGYGTQASGQRPAININTGNVVAAEVYGTSTATFAIGTGSWHHIVATWNGTTLTLYVDGVSRATATPTALTIPNPPAQGLSLGADGVSGRYFNGAMQECAVYNVALTSTQVTNHYNVGHAGGTTTTYQATILADAPIRYYRLGDASGSAFAADTISPTVSAFSDAGGNLSPAGRLTTLAGQATAGSFGAPVIVAQALQVHVTATTLQTILSWTPPAAGLYQVQMHISYGNNTTQNPQAKCSYFDPNLGNPSFAFMGAGNNIVLGGSYTATANVTIATLPMTIYAGTGGPITLTYQDPAGTPSDYIQAMIIRLA